MHLSSLIKRIDVYLDESGDLGFSNRSSRCLVVVALATADPLVLSRIVKRARQKLRYKRRRRPEIKFNSCPPPVRRQVLEGIASSGARIAWSATVKRKRNDLDRPDAEHMVHVLSERCVAGVSRTVHVSSMNIIVDKRWSKEKTRDVYDRAVTSAAIEHHPGVFPPAIRVSHMDSEATPGLQAADFVAGAVFQSVERGNDFYLKLIQSRVVESELL